MNWHLKWHPDRTIVVKERIEVEGYGPWSTKAGLQHVAPPIQVLSAMITIRIHLDDVDEENAPLKIALGSHHYGRIAEQEISDIISKSQHHICIARAGDVWLYATPIVHASDAATHPRRRRVLQVDYTAEKLPGGLEWLGI